MLSLVLVAGIVSGILMATRTAEASTSADLQNSLNSELATVTSTTSDNTNSTYNVTGDATNIVPGWGGGFVGFNGRRGGPCGRGIGGIEVSDEYKTTVTTIAKADSDVQQLLNEGYNFTRVMPIIKTTIDAQGNVVTKATNATVILEKDISGLAVVSVDLSQNKVTQIIIYTKTIIEK